MKSSRFAFLPVALIAAFILAIAGCGGDSGGTTTDNGSDDGATQTQSDTGDNPSEEGAEIFASKGCTGCHTLAAANATGTTGPNLDEKKPSKAEAVTFITDGKGAMPSFKDQLDEEQIDAVATYVSENAGK